MSESIEQGSGPVEDTAAATEPGAETPETPATDLAQEPEAVEPADGEAAAEAPTAEPAGDTAPATTTDEPAGEPAAEAEPATEPDAPAAEGETGTDEATPEKVVASEATPEASEATPETAEAAVTEEPGGTTDEVAPEASAEAAPTASAGAEAPAETETSEAPVEEPAAVSEVAAETATAPAETAGDAESQPATESETSEAAVEEAATDGVVVPEEKQSAPQAAAAEPQAAPAPAPAAPKPSAIPSPAAIARPRPPRPGAPVTTPAEAAHAAQAAPTAAPAPVVPVVDDAAAIADAEKYGRVAEDGTVYVVEQSGERVVGQFPGVETSEALSLYVRRYLDLVAKVSLFETRLDSADLSVKEIDQTLAKLGEETAEPAAVGDLDGLRSRVTDLKGRAAERRSALEAERAAAKAEAVKAREAIVEAAEKIAATDPAKMQWRPAGEELRALLDRWKAAQRGGPRIDRPTEEALWKRFSHARTAFDRERRHFFADLEQRNKAAKSEKELLVSEAEALSDSTDWGYTAGAYRDLMSRWKAAGRASRKDDDALWARFRAAQDKFFHARDEANAALDAEFGENLKVKEALLEEAEKLVPVTDLGSAKRALRGIQDRWDAAGKVPRKDIQRVENRMRAVENAIRDAEQDQWKRSNPETRARAEGAAAQLESAIADLEADLDKARSKGNDKKIAELESALAARRSWLEQVVKAAEES